MDKSHIQRSLIGSYKLQRVTLFEGGYEIEPFEAVSGLLIYTHHSLFSTHIEYHNLKNGLDKLKPLFFKEFSRINLDIGEYNANFSVTPKMVHNSYAGTYEIQDEKTILHYTSLSNFSALKAPQIRSFIMQGEDLIISAPLYLVKKSHGPMPYFKLYWTRYAAVSDNLTKNNSPEAA